MSDADKLSALLKATQTLQETAAILAETKRLAGTAAASEHTGVEFHTAVAMHALEIGAIAQDVANVR